MKGTFLAVLMMAGLAAAQTSYPPPPPARTPQPQATSTHTPPVAVAPQPQVNPNQLLSQLDQSSAALNASIAALRIDKWKTGSQEKAQLQSNADSIRRNLTNAFPTIVQDVRKAPDSLGATFKLYRTVAALYDVLAPLTQAAEALGPQNDFRDLSQQLQQLDNLRRSLGDRMEQLATAKDAQVAQLSTQLKQAQAAIPPKKIVVDDNEQPKPKKKKKSSSTTAQTNSKPQQQ